MRNGALTPNTSYCGYHPHKGWISQTPVEDEILFSTLHSRRMHTPRPRPPAHRWHPNFEDMSSMTLVGSLPYAELP